jgi:hypothetical protein
MAPQQPEQARQQAPVRGLAQEVEVPVLRRPPRVLRALLVAAQLVRAQPPPLVRGRLAQHLAWTRLRQCRL